MAGSGGKREGAGRPKGSVNKLTATIKEAIEQAFDQAGGVDYLVKMSDEEPKAFLTLLGRVIPKDVNTNMSGSLTMDRILSEIYGEN